MRDVHLRSVGKRDRLALIFRPKDNVHRRECRTHGNSEGPRIMPLVRAKVEVQDDLRSARFRLLGGENRSAAGWLAAQAGSGEFEYAAIGNGDGEDIIYRELN